MPRKPSLGPRTNASTPKTPCSRSPARRRRPLSPKRHSARIAPSTTRAGSDAGIREMAARFELGCDGPTTIVVGFDGSDTATRALYYALGLARRQHSSVIAVYAMTTLTGYDDAMGAAYQASLEVAEELKAKILALAADYHVKTQFVSVPGEPVTVLIKVAAAHHAD